MPRYKLTFDRGLPRVVYVSAKDETRAREVGAIVEHMVRTNAFACDGCGAAATHAVTDPTAEGRSVKVGSWCDACDPGHEPDGLIMHLTSKGDE